MQQSSLINCKVITPLGPGTVKGILNDLGRGQIKIIVRIRRIGLVAFDVKCLRPAGKG